MKSPAAAVALRRGEGGEAAPMTAGEEEEELSSVLFASASITRHRELRKDTLPPCFPFFIRITPKILHHAAKNCKFCRRFTCIHTVCGQCMKPSFAVKLPCRSDHLRRLSKGGEQDVPARR